MKLNKTTLATAVAATLALGMSGQAAASVYAGSRLEVQNLTINITGANGGVGITGYTFNLDNTARLNGVPDTSAGISTNCNSVGLPGCTVSPASPLTANAANAPGSNPLRVDGAANNFDFFGPVISKDKTYANSDSEIKTAQLVDGVPSSAVQITETEVAGTGTAQSSTTVQSNTSFTFTFDIGAGGGSFVLDFDADPDLYVAVDTLNLIGAFAQANTGGTFTLTSNNGTSVQWTPNGVAGGFTSCTGATCVEDNDEESLSNTIGLPSGNPNSAGISDTRSANDLGFSDFGITVNGLASGSYALTLKTDTSVNVVQSVQRVPEPGMIALLGIGFAGLGFMTRRRKV